MFDANACSVEQYTGLPVCRVGDGDLQLLHASIAQVVAYMAEHHLPRDAWDAPYVYRTDYLPDSVSGNDVAALSRIAAAAVARGIDLPPVMTPLYSGADAPVKQEDVYYVANNARLLGEVLGPVLSAMREADEVPCTGFPWGWLAAVAAGGVLLGVVLTASSRKQKRLEEEEVEEGEDELLLDERRAS
jgi:hypothetical protein